MHLFFRGQATSFFSTLFHDFFTRVSNHGTTDQQAFDRLVEVDGQSGSKAELCDKLAERKETLTSWCGNGLIGENNPTGDVIV